MRLKKTMGMCLVLAGVMLANVLVPPIEAQARVEADYIYISQLPGTIVEEKAYDDSFLSVPGFVKDGVSDRTHYYEEYLAYNKILKEEFIANGGKEEDYVMQNTEDYYVANNEAEFCQALAAYPKVIEVTADLNLGYKYLDEQGISHRRVGAESDYNKGNYPLTSPDMMKDGVSKIDFRDVDGMTIFSRNGSSIRHAEFQFSNCNDIVVRNLSFQCMNEWDDYPLGEQWSGTKPGNRKRYDWDLMTIYQSTNVWVDHCTFGLAYDGTIDISDASTATISWCEIGILDEYGEEELWNSINYMEASYQEGKGFQGYNAMRNAGATPEQIYRFAKLSDKVNGFGANDTNYDVNIYDRITLAYTYYEDTAQRVPQNVCGSSHMYNCWVNCMAYQKICAEIRTPREALSNAGISALGLCRANSARHGATIGTDTCIFEGVANPIIGNDVQLDGTVKGGINHNLIVNSSVQKYGSDTVYVGSSWDNEGITPFCSSDYWTTGKPGLYNFKWALWKDLTKDITKASDTVTFLTEAEASAMEYGEFYEKFYIGQDNLDYEYQIVPLENVKETLQKYSGCGKVDLGDDWLKTEYSTNQKACTVTFQFEGNGQASYSDAQVEIGATVTLPEVQEKTGYDAAGWYTKEYYIDEDGYLAYNEVPFTAETPITKDTTVFAKWSPKKYTVTFETNGGTTAQDTVVEMEYGSVLLKRTVDFSDIAKAGYLFAGWYTDQELTQELNYTIIKGHTTLYAKWTADPDATPTPAHTPIPTDIPNPTDTPNPGETTVPTESPAPAVLYGDVNLDEQVTAEDALEILKAVVKLITLDEIQTEAADVTNDEQVTAEDALEVLKKVVKLIERFPVEEA